MTWCVEQVCGAGLYVVDMQANKQSSPREK